MSDGYIQELANINARLAKLESKVEDWQNDIDAGGRIDQAFEVQSEHLESYIDRKIEEVKREIRSEIAGTNAKLDIILQRLTGILDADTP